MQESGITKRTLVLVGGGEWTPGCEQIDIWWSSRAEHEVVTVLTTAAQDGPGRALGRAEGYFDSLGCAVEACEIQTDQDAEDPRWLTVLGRAAAIFLCGGDPGAARRVLVGSPAGALLADRYRAGVPLIGSSAGAMVLAEACLLPSQRFAVDSGLGIVPHGLVVPHWNQAGAEWRQRALELVDEYEVLALDERTGLCWDGSAWSVRGAGAAHVLTSAGEIVAGGGTPSPPIE